MVVELVGDVRPAGVAESDEVGRDETPAPGQAGEHVTPQVGTRGAAVEKDDGIAVTVLDVVDVGVEYRGVDATGVGSESAERNRSRCLGHRRSCRDVAQGPMGSWAQTTQRRTRLDRSARVVTTISDRTTGRGPADRGVEYRSGAGELGHRRARAAMTGRRRSLDRHRQEARPVKTSTGLSLQDGRSVPGTAAAGASFVTGRNGRILEPQALLQEARALPAIRGPDH